ncbi:PREDICTED: membrane cofactor protein-like [Myotis davidii]|uniref:membrane cofactor protein-like n=1 Tax=Myotis davidii TaxID=225400 RepID=UPI0007671975|nr:PREDICTED: membrane cofactor protein-like [Myotis davidii]
MASSEPRWPPPQRHASAFSFWRSPGILLVALGLLLPMCSDACDDPMRFETMMLNGPPKASYGPGDRVEFKCRLGYKRIVPLVPTTAVCQPDNTWAPPLQEACTEKTCPQLGEPLNGEVVYVNGTTTFGSQAHYVCNAGYYLLGTKNLYCEISGNNVEWSDSPPQCEKILCQPPQQIPNGEFSNSHKDTFEYNEVVTYSCKPSNGPDEYSLVGESRLVCSGRNQWSSDPPECKVVKCQYPVLENGRVISGLRKKYYYKSEVTVECLEGFHLKGSKAVVCGVNNNWEPKMPECIKEHSTQTSKPPSKGNKEYGFLPIPWEMMASSEPRWPPPQRHASAFSFWRSPGILLVALGLLLPMCSGRDGKGESSGGNGESRGAGPPEPRAGEVCFVGRVGSTGLAEQGGAGGVRLRMAFQWYRKATAGTAEG